MFIQIGTSYPDGVSKQTGRPPPVNMRAHLQDKQRFLMQGINGECPAQFLVG